MLSCFLCCACGSAGKESACNVADQGLVPGWGRSPGEDKGYPLQYSGLESPMDGPWGRRVGHGWAAFTSLALSAAPPALWAPRQEFELPWCQRAGSGFAGSLHRFPLFTVISDCLLIVLTDLSSLHFTHSSNSRLTFLVLAIKAFFFFNWSIVHLQCWVTYCCTAKWLIIHIYSF